MERNEVIERVAREFVAFEKRHAARHRDQGLTEDQAVAEQQTGHRVCSWCGYCEGDCGR